LNIFNQTENTFNATAAESAGTFVEPICLHLLISASGGPESVPGAPTATSTSTAQAKAKSSNSNAGAIAGGVVGGIVFFGIVAGFAFMMMRRRKSQPTASTFSPQAVAYNSVTSPGTVMGYADGKDNFAKPALMASGRVYVSLVGHH
jgi:hypothetical protein